MAEGGGTALIHGLPLWANIILSGVVLLPPPGMHCAAFSIGNNAVPHVWRSLPDE